MRPIWRATPPAILLIVLSAFIALTSPTRAYAGQGEPPGVVTPFDLCTREDLLFAHLLAPLVKGDVADWTILGGLAKQVGDWVDRFVGAQQIANLITQTFPIEGQPALRPLEAEVERCARVLGIDKPVVYVRNSPFTEAYVAHAFGRDHLVVTSGLLSLYAGSPEELRFIIGHELGHVVCGHLELKHKAFGLLAAVLAINLAVVPDKFQAVLPTLGLGRLYTWCRESEISADRADLLCCGEPKVAYQAIMRLQHGLNADSPWIDPEKPEFDVEKVIKDFQQWQYQPFVKLILDLKRHTLVHPFVPERLAALKAWADTGAYRSILKRKADERTDQLIEVVKIVAYELAPEGQSIDPYVIVSDRDQRVLRTATASGQRAAEWQGFKSTDKGVDQPRVCRDGQPLFFEIWDDNFLTDDFVGGFVVYPDGRDAAADPTGERTTEYTAKILWDWNEPRSISRPGFAKVTVKFTQRQALSEENPSRKATP